MKEAGIAPGCRKFAGARWFVAPALVLTEKS